MPQKASAKLEKIDDFVMDTYETTVPMSTYLVAYGVSDFEYKEATVNMKDDVKFRIYARRDAMDQVDYALEVGPKVLKFYEVKFADLKVYQSLSNSLLSLSGLFSNQIPIAQDRHDCNSWLFCRCNGGEENEKLCKVFDD